MKSVYVIHNSATGKNYVGLSGTPKWRVKNHFKELRSNRHKNKSLQEDFNTYGEKVFIYNTLDCFEDDEAKRMEVFMMQVLRSKDVRYGYNCNDRTGTSKYAILDRWRTIPAMWNGPTRRYYKKKYGVIDVYSYNDPARGNKHIPRH